MKRLSLRDNENDDTCKNIFCIVYPYLITKQKHYNNYALMEFKPNEDLLAKHS